MVDLNTLIPPGSGIELAAGVSINDCGEIDGNGVLPNGDSRAILLIPCDENYLGVEGRDYSLVDSAAEPQSPAPSFFPSATQRSAQSRRTNWYHVSDLRRSDR
jgi:hypothetical protein